MKILVVDDEPDICEILQYNLETEGYEVVTANSAEEALELHLQEFALILLDVMMGEMSGFQMARKMKDNSSMAQIPIIFITALEGEDNLVKGLNIGADDYIEKPYDIDILLAKIRGIFKRKFSIDEIVDGELKLNCATKTLYVAGELKEVTAKEFDLLKLLIDNKGVTLKKAFIFNSIWGSDSESEMQTLNVHIKWLREKIEKDPKNPSRILTVWGVGYRFE
jgi:DNA-binding response OmpR family regulator